MWCLSEGHLACCYGIISETSNVGMSGCACKSSMYSPQKLPPSVNFGHVKVQCSIGKYTGPLCQAYISVLGTFFTALFAQI